MMPTLKITPEMAGDRLDVVLARAFPDYSRVFLQKWVKGGHVTCSGKPAESRVKVRAGDVFEVDNFQSVIPAKAGIQYTNPGLVPGLRRGDDDKAGVKIIFEDKDLLVLNKPAGLVAHPAPSHRGTTLVDWVKAYFGPERAKLFPDPDRLGLVHRLDKDTTGIVVVAKTPVAQTALARQFQDRQVRKTYCAIVEGVPTSQDGVISAPVGRSLKNPSRMAVTGSGRPSETTFSVLQPLKEVSLMQLLPKTGRTHQIRVHCAAIGHPIVGDLTYGAKNRWAEEFKITRPLLHAESLEFKHPRTGKILTVKAPRPADFKAALSVFKKAFALIGVTLLLAGGLSAAPESAKPSAVVKKKTTTTKSTAKAPSASAESSTVRQLKTQANELQLQVNALNDQLGQLAAALEQLNLATRLRDIEKSVADLNTRVSSVSNSAEESKSQGMEAVRRLKSMQDSVDTLRDQFDRLTRDMIQLRAQREGAATAAEAP